MSFLQFLLDDTNLTDFDLCPGELSDSQLLCEVEKIENNLLQGDISDIQVLHDVTSFEMEQNFQDRITDSQCACAAENAEEQDFN